VRGEKYQTYTRVYVIYTRLLHTRIGDLYDTLGPSRRRQPPLPNYQLDPVSGGAPAAAAKRATPLNRPPASPRSTIAESIAAETRASLNT